MGNLVDISGRRFGRLVITRRDGSDKHGQAFWSYVCDCGETGRARGFDLRRNRISSCGCYQSEWSKKKHTTHGATTEGSNIKKEYMIWHTMIRRCHDKKNPKFSLYGKRGIVVCERWRSSFSAFMEDMGKRPKDKDSIERIDNNKEYSPRNCKWATAKEQANNTRSNVLINYVGSTRNATQWAEQLGVHLTTILYRHRHGIPLHGSKGAAV